MDYQNKVALITGGSSGIGLALAKALSARGAHVWVMARHQEQLDEALNEILAAKKNPDQKAGAVSCDVMDWDQVTSAVDKVVQAVGVPDLLINSAGAAHPGHVEELDIKIFRWMMELNYFGTVYATKACLPGMIQRKSGHIINISSVAGFIGVYGYTAYGAAKFAVSGFSDVLRAEMKPHGIHVSIVYPTNTDTRGMVYENQFKPAETKALEGTVKMIPPEQVARSVLKGIERGRYVIMTGFEPVILRRLSGFVGNAIYPIMDFMIAQSHNGNGNGHGPKL